MRCDAGQVDVHVLQIWFSRERVWRDVKEFADKAECAYIAARANDKFPQDRFRAFSRPGRVDGAGAFPRCFPTSPAFVPGGVLAPWL